MTRKRDRGRFVALLAAVAAALAIAVPASASGAAQPRVVGGHAADISAYPWQAALVLDSSFGETDPNGQFCGGVVIAPRIVLTAAHCVYDLDPDCAPVCTPLNDPGGDGTVKVDPNDVDVVLNKTTLSTGGGERHDVQATYYQQDYNPSANSNDVGYLVLSTATGQQPIKLAGPTETALMAPGYPTEVSGYGVTDPNASAGSDGLRAATVPIIADGSCSGSYGSEFIAGAMVCAGYLTGGADACFGDSGGPLEAPAQGGVYRLDGLVSWGGGPNGCGDPNAPGVYARVGAGAPGWLHQAVVSKVASIETAQGLPPTDIVGSGALSVTAPAPVARKKCRKHKKLNKKTGKCVKKKKRKHRKRR